jgi:molybdate transport system ATP-binding protein
VAESQQPSSRRRSHTSRRAPESGSFSTPVHILSGRIADIRLGEGPGALVTLCVGDDPLIARITRRSAEGMGLFTGQTCHAMIRSVAVAPEDVGTGRKS